MPEISRFYGIVIKMYYNDHNPPHFHAEYASGQAVVRIAPVGLLEGELPPRILAMIIEWAALHRGELNRDWELARANQPLVKIEGLP